jgi:ATP-dependent helicase/nuclease subunit A
MKANFRSRKEIIAAVNSIFRSCMSRELGDVDYTQPDHQLDAAADYAGEGEKPQFIVVGVPPAAERKEAGTGRKDYEAAWVAGEIRRLIRSGMLVKDKEELRPVRWSDVAVLLRSFTANEAVFRRELEKQGIPVLSSSGTDLYTEPETAFLMNMLSIVDNPHKDVPLLAVLRSPAFGFTADELAEIRVSDREHDLFYALSAAAEKNEKCARFLQMLEACRASVPDTQVSELVWRIICEQDLLAVCSAMDEGEQRRDRILNFIELCGRFEESDSRGLHSFLLWLEHLNEQERIPNIVSGRSGGVSILSVHRSKGLEYPVVFVSGTGTLFSNKDYSGSVLTDPELGLGSKKTDRERRIEYPTLARTAIEQKRRRENLSEEMRLQYVALTRARERLYITGTADNPDTLLKKAANCLDGAGMPDPEYLSGAGSALQWFAAAAAADGGKTFVRRTVSPGEEAEPEDVPVSESERPEEEQILPLEQQLRKNLSAVYPYSEAAALPSKITATELKTLRSEGEEEEAARMPSLSEETGYSFPLPVFRRGEHALGAAERGTAMHALLQHLDWAQTLDGAGIRGEIGRVKAAGFLTEEEAASIDPAAVERLAGSPLGGRMAAAWKKGSLQREFRFSLLVDADRLLSTQAREQILLQGVIDCFFEEEDGIVLVDYKTDRVSEEKELLARAEHYRDQLEAYAEAITRITGKPVKERILVFLAAGREIRLEKRG